MFLIYYCCLVDYAIRLTCKCIVFFGKKGFIRHIFDHCHSCNRKIRHIKGITLRMLS